MDLKQARKIIYSGEPFDLTYVKADVGRNTGGQLRTYKGCTVVNSDVSDKDGGGKTTTTNRSKDPDHKNNGTVNIRVPEKGGSIRKVHLSLITYINKERVI